MSAFFDDLSERVDLRDPLVEDFGFNLGIDSDGHLVPTLTDPALGCIFPITVLLDLVVTDDSGENDFLHVASHGVLHKQLVSNLVDTHKHEGHLSCCTVVLTLEDFLFSGDPLSFDFELFLHLVRILLLLLLEFLDLCLLVLIIQLEVLQIRQSLQLLADLRLLGGHHGLCHLLLLLEFRLSLLDLTDELAQLRILVDFIGGHIFWQVPILLFKV